MFAVYQSAAFKRWFGRLRDSRAVALVNARILKVSSGQLGDARRVGDGVYEMRIHYGPGYRLYFIREGGTVIVLLCGGDKSSQRRDIERAKRMARDWDRR